MGKILERTTTDNPSTPSTAPANPGGASLFGQEVKEGRLKLKKTQRELAQHVGISRSLISKIESGEEIPSQKLCERVSEALAIPLPRLLDLLRQTRGSRSGEQYRRRVKELQGNIIGGDEYLMVYTAVGDRSAGGYAVGTSIGASLRASDLVEFTSSYAEWIRFHSAHATPVILVGRATSDNPVAMMAHHAVLAGLLASACHVLDVGTVTTPNLQFLICSHKAQGAICITESDTTAQISALKFFGPDGAYLDRTIGLEVVQKYRSGQFIWGIPGGNCRLDRMDDANMSYIEHVLQSVDSRLIHRRKFKVALDGGNGVGESVAGAVLRRLGCNVVLTKGSGNPLEMFRNTREPNEERLSALCSTVREEGADIGFAIDTDGDRLEIVTDEGLPVESDQTLVWVVSHCLQNREAGPVVTNICTTMAVEVIAQQFGCPVYRTLVGDTHISKKMRETGAVVGGEGHGSVNLPAECHVRDATPGTRYYARDAIRAIVLILEFLEKSQLTAAALARSTPLLFIKKQEIEFPPERIAELLSRLLEWDGQIKGLQYDGIRRVRGDGLKYEWLSEGEVLGWAHMRPSATRSMVRLICEAHDPDQVEIIQANLIERIHSAREVPVSEEGAILYVGMPPGG
jgi:phosphomannomutase